MGLYMIGHHIISALHIGIIGVNNWSGLLFVLIIQVQGLLLSDEEQALKDYAHQIVISIGQAQSAIAWFNLWQGYFYILRSSS